MGNQKRRIAALTELAVAEGLKVESIRLAGSGHIRICVVRADGRKRLVFASATPSDHRADLNLRALLRRISKQDHDGP